MTRITAANDGNYKAIILRLATDIACRNDVLRNFTDSIHDRAVKIILFLRRRMKFLVTRLATDFELSFQKIEFEFLVLINFSTTYCLVLFAELRCNLN